MVYRVVDEYVCVVFDYYDLYLWIIFFFCYFIIFEFEYVCIMMRDLLVGRMSCWVDNRWDGWWFWVEWYSVIGMGKMVLGVDGGYGVLVVFVVLCCLWCWWVEWWVFLLSWMDKVYVLVYINFLCIFKVLWYVLENFRFILKVLKRLVRCRLLNICEVLFFYLGICFWMCLFFCVLNSGILFIVS